MCEGRSFSRYHLHYPGKISYLLFPSISYPLTRGTWKPTQQLLCLFYISAFSLPAPKLPSTVFHLKMPSSLRSFCVRAFLSVSVFLHTPLIQRLYHVPTIMKFSFFVKTEACFSGISYIFRFLLVFPDATYSMRAPAVISAGTLISYFGLSLNLEMILENFLSSVPKFSRSFFRSVRFLFI